MSRSFEKKLFIPRSREGAPNTEALEQVRELENQLKTHRAFVGLALYGSAVRGYSDESSDIDCIILYDAPSAVESMDVREELEKIANRTRDEFMLDRKKYIAYQFKNINP